MKVSFGRGTSAAVVIAAGAIAMLFLWRGRDHATTPSPSAQPKASAPGHAPAAPELAGAEPPPGAEAVKAELSSTTLIDPPPGDDFEDNPLANVLHGILSNDRQLTTFMYYHNRPLLDEANRVKYHQFLSDPAIFANVEHDLLYPEEATADQASNIKRLLKIDYLRAALEWKENPMRGALISLISDMILTDNYPAGMGMGMRLSLSGNKMELYELLTEYAPDRASAVLLASKGTRLEAMLAYIANSLQVRRQIESNVETEVHR